MSYILLQTLGQCEDTLSVYNTDGRVKNKLSAGISDHFPLFSTMYKKITLEFKSCYNEEITSGRGFIGNIYFTGNVSVHI